MLICKRVSSVRYLHFANNYDNTYKSVCQALRHSKALFIQNNGFIDIKRVKLKSQINNNQYINVHHFKSFSNVSHMNQKCWKCDHIFCLKKDSKIKIICEKCQTIQALDPNVNYFELFNIKISFDVNLLHLNKEFKSLQMRSHPDKFAKKSERERLYSMDNSSLINKAYKTLRDPYERGLYLLDILFHSTINETDVEIDLQFLHKIMELNEDITANDTSEHKLINILKQNQEDIKNITNQISIAFGTKDGIKAKQLLANLKFYISVDLNLKERLQKYLFKS